MEELLNKKALTAGDKQSIEAAYLAAFGVEMPKRKNCRDCYNDAITQILIADPNRKKTPRLLYGDVLVHEGAIYTRATEVPKEIIELYKDRFRYE